MASNIVRIALILFIFYSGNTVAGDVYRFGTIYSDSRHNGDSNVFIADSAKGFDYKPKDKAKNDDSVTYIVNHNNYDPLVGIALESQFLLQLYKLADRFVLQSERDRVREEVVRRINELHGL